MTMPDPRPAPARCLHLFTKPARPGRVKTRLTRGPGALAAEQAAFLHAAFLGDLAERLLPATAPAALGEPPELRLRVAWAPDDRGGSASGSGGVRNGGAGNAGVRNAGTGGAAVNAVLGDVGAVDAGVGDPLAAAEGRGASLAAAPGDLEGRLPDLVQEVGDGPGEGIVPRWPLHVPAGARLDALRQQGPTLGDRLFHALSSSAPGHPEGVAAVGSDHPTLPLAWIRAAFDALAVTDVVLGPADDGGYYLVALRPEAVRRELFERIPWSTAGVLVATEEACHHLGLSVVRLPAGRDVDEPADLAGLADFLAGKPGARAYDGESRDCPRTCHLLRVWGRLGLD